MILNLRLLKLLIFYVTLLLFTYSVIWFNYCIKKPLMRELKIVLWSEKFAIPK